MPAGAAATTICDFSYNGITLDALTLYYVGSYQPFDPVTSLNLSDYGTPPVDAAVVLNADAFGIGTGTGLVFPGQSTGMAGADLGANFTDDAVPAVADLPEPATLAILGISLAGLAGWRRRTVRK